MSVATRPRWVLLTALSLVALNLRIALSSLPAVVTEIQSDTGWSDAAIGMLTTIPVLCMGGFALLVPRIAQRFGRAPTVAFALGLLIVALASRLAGAIPGVLWVSAFLAGTGIALAAGLVPGVVREQLPGLVGRATGLWTGAMMIGAALGGALTVPLMHWLGSWEAALAAWAVPAAIALAAWVLVERGNRERPTAAAVATVRIRNLPWRSRPAWGLTAYLTLNSIAFYTTLAWLAPSYVERGSTPAEAGGLFGLFTGAQVIGALLLPAMAERFPARRAFYAAFVVVAALALAMVAVAPHVAPPVVVMVYGLALGGGFAMGLALLSEYAHDGGGSARITAMAYSVTYLTAALGPFIAGTLLDTVGSWPLVYGLLVVVLLLQLVSIVPLRRGVRIN